MRWERSSSPPSRCRVRSGSALPTLKDGGMAEHGDVITRYYKKGPQSLRQAEEVGLIGSRVWTQPEILVSLREYKKRECLYDMKNSNYRNKFARQEALDDIAKILSKIRPQTTGMDVKLKFNILRTQYHAELSKEKKYAESGKLHVTTLWFMDHIKFVRGQNRRELYGQQENKDLDYQNSEPLFQVRYEDQASLSEDYFIETDDKYNDYEIAESNEDPLSNTNKRNVSLVIKTEKLGENTESEIGSDSPNEKEAEEERSNSPIISPATSTLSNQKRRGKKFQASESHPRKVEEPNDVAEEIPVQNSEEDLFGQIVAKKLKKITNPRKRADTEFKIFSILHSALVEELDSV